MQFDLTVYRSVFFQEAAEHLTSLEAALLKIYADPTDTEAIDEAFRAAHSVKGGADAVGFGEIARFTHGMENLLDQLRIAAIPISGGVLDLLLEGSDMIAGLMQAAKTDGPKPTGIDELLASLTQTCTPTDVPVPKPTDVPAPKPTDVELKTFVVTIAPNSDAFRAGLDPIPLLRELAHFGTVHRVSVQAREMPSLIELDPERCYLSWILELETAQPASAIQDVFRFAADNISVTVEPKREARIAPLFEELDGPVETTADAVQLAKYLVEQGTIQPDQALAAFDRQRANRPQIGRLAIESGFMTTEDVFETLIRMEPGQQFGQTALSYRLLKESQLNTLLRLQDRSTPTFGECLIANGAISPEKLEQARAGFTNVVAPTVEPETADTIDPVPVTSSETPMTLRRENAELIGEFCSENEEHLETADRYLLTIDGNPTDSESLNAVYRSFHTLKGGASMLGLTAIKTLAHEAENLLNLARDGKVVLQEKALDLVFASTDALKRQIVFLRKWLADFGVLETDPKLPALITEIRTFANPSSRAEPTVPTPVSVEPIHEEPTSVAGTPAAEAPASTNRRTGPTEKDTVRVDKARLDKLINSIGELVIAQSMAEEEFHQLTHMAGNPSHALTELSKISRDIQELGLSLRMVPLQGIFQKMARLVRDLSRKMQKPVELDLYGEDTEIDKTVVDQLGDPLMHMVRNAIDHGLESPDERVAVGKPREGNVKLKAYHQGGSVYIELTDDGKGLDKDRIFKKAVEKGIIADDARLSDAEIYALIFEPGFSTAAKVTDVSGRGVGMDVVRRNVELLQGSIHIRTALGKGTTFCIRLPLTLAIMDGLLIGLGNDVFIIPLLSVVESFRPRRADLYTVAGKAELVSVRGETVPLLRLKHLLNVAGTVSDPCEGLLVLVEDQGNKYALLIDELLGQMQAVVKSLDTNYRAVEGLAGATILGNGRVAMILDVHGLASLHSQTGYPTRTYDSTQQLAGVTA